MLNDITFDMPAGPGNLAVLFPAIDFRMVDEYLLELINDNDETVVTTPTFRVSKEWTAISFFRLHFLNYNGRFDSISFHYYNRTDDVKSTTWTKASSYPLVKSYGGMQRSQVRARNSFKAIHSTYSEAAQKWLEELLESPLAFMELAGHDGQPDDYVPIVITDKQTTTLKEEDRFNYETVIEFSMAHEKLGVKL